MISGNFKRKNNEKKPGYLRYDDVFMSNNSGYNSRSQDNLRRNQNFSSNRRQQDVYDNDYEDEYYNDDIPQENDDYDDRVSMNNGANYNQQNYDNSHVDYDDDDNIDEVYDDRNFRQYRNSRDIRRENSSSSSSRGYSRRDMRDNVNFSSQHPMNNRRPSPGNELIDEKMIRFQKRQLPPLQRYGNSRNNNNFRDYDDSEYWNNDNDDYNPRRFLPNRNGMSFKNIWHKFILTFAGLISLVCVSWILYNWNNNDSQNNPKNLSQNPTIIEPENPSFKVLPDESQNSSNNVPHQDKRIYDRMGKSNLNKKSSSEDITLLPPQETPSINQNERVEESIPEQNTNNNVNMNNKQNIVQNNNNNNNNINQDNISTNTPPNNNDEEYAIVDDKVYYIKISSNKNKAVLQGEINNIRSRYSDKIDGKECSIKSVRDKNREKKHAILIGPYDSRNQAIEIAQKLNTSCSVVAVRE